MNDRDRCPIHDRPLIHAHFAYCPVCRGQAGGRKKSMKKTLAAVRNAHARKRKPKEIDD